MSNTTMTPVAPVPMAPMEAPAAVAETPKKKTFGYRLLAILTLALCVGILLLPISTYTSAWEITKQSVIAKTLSAMLKSKDTVLGFLPALIAGEGTIIAFANLLIYGLIVATIVSAILSIIAVITGNKCFVNAALFFITFAGLVYALGVYSLSTYLGNVLSTSSATLDTNSAIIGVAGLVLTLFLQLAKNGKAAWLWLLNVVLALAASALVFISVMEVKTFNTATTVAFVIAALLLVNAIITYFFVKMQIARAAIALILAAVALILCFVGVEADLIFMIVAAVIALVQFLLALILRPRKVKEPAPDPVAALLASFQREEYIEAYAYDGGPVAGVELAEEVYPTVAAIEAIKDPDGTARNTVASLLGNGFDPFLITLSEKEKNEFIDVYVLKCRGLMPEIPGYVVGGDNRDFFNKVFIYLGQYREKISGELLSKMYDFSMKI